MDGCDGKDGKDCVAARTDLLDTVGKERLPLVEVVVGEGLVYTTVARHADVHDGVVDMSGPVEAGMKHLILRCIQRVPLVPRPWKGGGRDGESCGSVVVDGCGGGIEGAAYLSASAASASFFLRAFASSS